MHKNKMKNITFLLLIFALMSALFMGCSNNNEPAANTETSDPVSESFFIFDTIVQVRVYDTRADEDTFKNVENILKRIDHEVNRQNEDSEISKVNANAGNGSFIPVSEETFKIIERAVSYSKASNGVFDLTVGPLVDLWGIGEEGASVPSETDIADRMKLIDHTKVELNKEEHSVRLLEPNMSIDLGGIAKGYSADAIADYLREEGFKSAIIDLGGNVLAVGPKPGNKDWTIGIQNPEENRGAHIGTIKVKDTTVVSSGIYERFFFEDGIRYHHIMDTSTGYPVQNNLTSVTVVTRYSFDADGRSNTAFAMGLEKGMEFIKSLGNVEAIFITKDREVYTTPGLADKLEITDSNFKLIR